MKRERGRRVKEKEGEGAKEEGERQGRRKEGRRRA